jgi:hypothetical protein
MHRCLFLLLLAGCASSSPVSSDDKADPGNPSTGGRDGGADVSTPVVEDAGADVSIVPDAPMTTRLRIKNRCESPIWIAHSDNVGEKQNVKLVRGAYHDYKIPEGGLASARWWAKTGCNDAGQACATGDTGEGGGKPCPASGCQPPIDSKFEATFAGVNSNDATWYNLSQVDGYTLPFKVTPRGDGAEKGSCVTSDCGKMTLEKCPGNEDMTGGGRYPGYANQDLRVRDGAGKVIGCLAPCKKWNYPAPYGLGKPESDDPGLHMCCPTPIDPAKNPGQCTIANKCMTAEACRSAADPVSVVHTRYVKAMHEMCPSAYAYSYDDEAGLHTCPKTTAFEVVFCP